MPRLSSSPACRASSRWSVTPSLACAVREQQQPVRGAGLGRHGDRHMLDGQQPAGEKIGAAARRELADRPDRRPAPGRVHRPRIQQQLGLAVEGDQGQPVARAERLGDRNGGAAGGVELVAGHGAGDVDGQRQVARRRFPRRGPAALGGEVGDEVADRAAALPGEGRSRPAVSVRRMASSWVSVMGVFPAGCRGSGRRSVPAGRAARHRGGRGPPVRRRG